MTQLAGISQEELEELSMWFGEVCQSAVHPFEVASALEFEGVSDRTARVEYGAEDVFALARVLYRRVPRKPADPEPEPDPWSHGPLRPLLHGLLYALPAVCFPAAAALLTGPRVLPALVVALLTGWGLSQGLAAIGYQRLGTAGRDQAGRVLRVGLATGLAAVGVVMIMTGLVTGAHPAVLGFGAGEAAYMLGACVLLVTGTESWLLVALAPGVVIGGVFLLSGKPPGLEHLTWAALAATPVLACAIPLSGRAFGTGPGRLLVGAELRSALPAILLGVAAAGLLSFPVVAGPTGHGGINVGALVASVPLALSMGAAEWSLLWYRRRTRRLLGITNNPRWFRRHARLSLLRALLQYLSGAVVLVGLATGVGIEIGQLRPAPHDMLPEIAAFLMLGTAMFLILLLQAVRVRAVPLTAAAVALGAEVILRQHGLAVQVAVPAVLLVVVGGYALYCLGAAVRHA